MHSSIQCRLVSVNQSCIRRACRVAARRRLPDAVRKFHLSQPYGSTSSDPHGSVDPTLSNNVLNEFDANWGPDLDASSAAHVRVAGEPPIPMDKPSNKNTGPYGSAIRRAMRHRRPRERATPVARIPPWFCERNTVLQGDSIQ